ncbi:hypothetical protein GOB94_10790 [Granulicella sp. 5B5]|uniref:hypothetical protein n=1 Tax=Granulicella sp. 5B5 TaxID=1617967 RepID=UPI00176C48D9|nr:hypothetical protein [Granulicella sp. 5B5]QMV19110.1 hypothetical protein GOB94_10790 [Granulicella sp. 5B5]
MPTGIGLVFIFVGLYCFFRKRDYLFPLLLFSTIFPATSAISFGNLGIMPYYVLAPMFVIAQIFQGGIKKRFQGDVFLVAFAVLGVLSAILCPLFFAGVQVYSEHLGTSDLVFQTFPLVFSVANAAQAGYLLMNVLVVFAAASAFKSDKVWIGINAAFYCMIGTIAGELVALLLGVPFPYSLFENSPETASMQLIALDPTTRLHATCGEPSYAGLVLVVLFSIYFYRSYVLSEEGWKAILCAVGLFLVRSSSAMVALAAVIGLVVAFNLPVRVASATASSSIRMRQLVRLVGIAAVIGIALLSSSGRDLVQRWIIDKPGSGSYEHRTTMDKYSLQLVGNTYGIGVGTGSYRPSSLLASLLGNVGVLGTILFGMTFLGIIRGVPRNKAWLRWAMIAALLDMAIAIPDITEPFLWALTALVVHVSLPGRMLAGYVLPKRPYGTLPSVQRQIVQSADH